MKSIQNKSLNQNHWFLCQCTAYSKKLWSNFDWIALYWILLVKFKVLCLTIGVDSFTRVVLKNTFDFLSKFSKRTHIFFNLRFVNTCIIFCIFSSFLVNRNLFIIRTINWCYIDNADTWICNENNCFKFSPGYTMLRPLTWFIECCWIMKIVLTKSNMNFLFIYNLLKPNNPTNLRNNSISWYLFFTHFHFLTLETLYF